MAKTTKGSSEFQFPASTLLEVLLNGDYQVESTKLSDSVKDAKFQLVSRTETEAVYEIRSAEYERGLTGLNKSKTVETVTRVQWNLKTMASTWTYSNPAVDRFKLGGASRIENVGDGCRLSGEATVEVKIPFVGGKIESMVAEGIESGRAKDAELMRAYAKKLG